MMKNIALRGLDDAVMEALRLEARLQQRSLEEHLRVILQRAALPEGRMTMGHALRMISRRAEGVTLEMVRRPAEPMPFDEMTGKAHTA